MPHFEKLPLCTLKVMCDIAIIGGVSNYHLIIPFIVNDIKFND